jgi:glycerophosphoryl diester phosphodiesterase
MTIVVAHRGASKACRENTVDAFVEARRQGAAMVEFDVRRTADGVLVVHHDPRIDGLGPIVGAPASALPDYVPTFDAALDACVGMDVNIEIKNDPTEPDFDSDDRVAHAVMARLADLGDAARMLISSFRQETIDAVRVLNPRIRTGYLFTMPPLSPLRMKALVLRIAAAGHDAIHPYHRGVSPRMVSIAHDVGLDVNTWTVDDPKRIRALARMGVDAVITNTPATALTALAHGVDQAR